MRLLPPRWLFPFTLVVLLLPACGDSADDGADTTLAPTTITVETTTTTEAPTTTVTTTTTPPTTTTEAPTTTTEPEGGADWGVVVGDCYINTDSGEGNRIKVPCDESHHGEVFAIIRAMGSVDSNGLGRPPNPDAVRAEILEHLSDYVGVETVSVLDWLPSQGITAVFIQQQAFDGSGLVSTESFCSLVAEEGDLTSSYRSD